MDSNNEDLFSSIKELDEKMTAFSSILEKFGLDVITKMGQTNLKITQLTGDVEKLNKVITKILGLEHNLDKVIKKQDRVEDELNTIKSLIMNLTSLPSKKLDVENTIERDESATDKKDLIITQLNELKANLENINDPKDVKPILEKIKEEIFEFTGGHRMLYKISQMIAILDSANSLNDLIDDDEQPPKSLKKHLEDKITFWINKLMIKN